MTETTSRVPENPTPEEKPENPPTGEQPVALSPIARHVRKPSRRGFLIGGGLGLLAGVPLGWYAHHKGTSETARPRASGFTEPHRKASIERMPGPFPGEVVEISHAGAVSSKYVVDPDAVREMVARGMCELTGEEDASDAWKRFFEPDDVVGIKVNPVGNSPTNSPRTRAISHPLIVIEVVRGLRAAGVKPKNIILFERYASEFVAAGYDRLLFERDLQGVRWYAAGTGYSNTQLEIDGIMPGIDHSPDLVRHVVGYDPDSFVHMPFAAPEHSQKDDRRFRSHLTTIVSRMVNKVVTIPVLKDHRSAGVTLALKNMSHGMNNNVARSHISGIAHGFPHHEGLIPTGPNQCNTFIPAAVNQPAIREKATLHILDGLIGVYEGGPGTWNRSWGVWPFGSLLFATDPVALDMIGWGIIDAKRLELKLPRVAEMGRHRFTTDAQTLMALSRFSGTLPLDAINIAAAESFLRGAGNSEVFDRRQPEHIYLAGTIGLGEVDLNNILHRRKQL